MERLLLKQPVLTISDVTITSTAELWAEFSKALAAERIRQGLTWSQVEHEYGGPDSTTQKRIESGQVGNVTTLEEFCSALGTSTIDLLQKILLANLRDVTLEELTIIRAYRLSDVVGRHALTALATALLAHTPHIVPELPAEPTPSSPHSPLSNTDTPQETDPVDTLPKSLDRSKQVDET
jgi:transcriptional regulator with XRE-family HTH domain